MAEWNWEEATRRAGNLASSLLIQELKNYGIKEEGIDKNDLEDFVLDSIIHVYGSLRRLGYECPDRNYLNKLGYK